MFTRRVLQRCIDESFSYASDKTRRLWVKKLNSSSEPAYAATEWEIVLLHTMAQFGILRHEPQLEGTSLIDIVFEHPSFSFGADITTVSDRGLHERNPVHKLEERLRSIYETAGIAKGGIGFHVTEQSSFGKRQGRSSIVPPVSDFEKLIFNEDFYRWISNLQARPEEQSTFRVIYRNPLSVIAFTYVPGRQGAWCGGYTSYRVARSVNKNPLYNALVSKSEQLKRSRHNGPLGIVVCDGGADVLRQNFSGNISGRDVAFEFLRRHTSVNFVVIFSLRNIDSSTIRQRVDSQIYVLREEPWHKDLEELFGKITGTLPQVRQTAENAANELKFWEGRKRLNLGGLSMSLGPTGISEIRMSTRTLLDVLAGRLSSERLNKHYQHGNSGHGLFEHLVRSGSLIESARVEIKPNEDDDEIVFRFGKPDPATASFTIPDSVEKV